MDTLFYSNQKRLNGLGFEPVTTATAATLIKLSPQIAEVVKKLARFFSGIISNDNGIIAARDKMLAYIRARFRNLPNVDESIIVPLLTFYKLRHADIPNAKVLGNYDAETQRLVECMTAYLLLYEPQFVNAFLQGIPQFSKPDHAFLNAVIGQSSISRDAIAGHTTALTQPQVAAALTNAANAGGIESLTPSTATSSSSIAEGANVFQEVRDIYGRVVQPGTPEYQAAIQQQPRQAGAGSNVVWVIGIALALAVAAFATAPAPKKK